MNDRARTLFVAGDGTGAGGATDGRNPWRDLAGSEMIVEGPAAKFAAGRARTVDAVIRCLVRFAGWLLIVGGFFALVDGTTSEAQVKKKVGEPFALVRPSGDSGIRRDLAE